MIIPDIKLTSYLIAVSLTLLCLLTVNIMMSGKLRKIEHGVFFEIRGLKGGFTDGLHIELGDYAIDKRGSSKNCS